MLAAVGSTHWHLNPTELQIASGFAIPLVVGFITKLRASSAVKALLNFLLSAIAGGLTVALAANGDVVGTTWLLGIAQTFVVSIASYYGLWKHTVAPAIAQSTPNFGIGTPQPGYVPTDQYGTYGSSGVGSPDDVLPGQSQVDVEGSEPKDATLDQNTGVAEDVAPAPAVRATKAKTATKKSTARRSGPQKRRR